MHQPMKFVNSFNPAPSLRLPAHARNRRSKVGAVLLSANLVLSLASRTAAVDTNGVNPIWIGGGVASVGSFSFAISKDGQYLAHGPGRVWRLSDRKLVGTFPGRGPFVLTSDASHIAGPAGGVSGN